MIKKTITEQKRERVSLIILFLLALVLSNLGIPGMADSTIMPNYFIALIITLILNRLGNLNLYKLVIFGLIIDLFVGQLLGQYGFIFICISLGDYIIKKALFIKNEKQVITLISLLTLISFIALCGSSLSHGIFISPKIIFLQTILTFILCLILNFFIKKIF
jgi:rod shape-determining protein MreD